MSNKLRRIFQAVDTLTMSHMKLWDLIGTSDIEHYMDELKKLQPLPSRAVSRTWGAWLGTQAPAWGLPC